MGGIDTIWKKWPILAIIITPKVEDYKLLFTIVDNIKNILNKIIKKYEWNKGKIPFGKFGE